MIEIVSRLTELENLLKQVPAKKRGTLLIAIADLFVDNVAKYSPAQISLFDRLFSHLVEDADKDAAAALARRIAPLARAPIAAIDRLAHEQDITVAEPVLMRSPCIEDRKLTEIARTGSQLHLLAIACRSRLSRDIVDLLLARGDKIVVRYLTNNRGAEISDGAAAALIERAKGDEALAILVARRNDIPPRLLAMLPKRAAPAAPASP